MSAAAAVLRGRRILVTGASGFIGRHVVADLTAAGARVRAVDLKPHPDPDVDLVQGDLGEPSILEEAFAPGCDAVVHLAAVTSVLRSLEHPDRTYRTNVATTNALLEAARAAGAGALVFASTNAVTGPMEAPAISESATLKPLTPYGATKAAAEMLMSAYTASFGLRCTSLRLTNVFGPGMQAKDSIVARLMRAIRLGTEFEVYGDGRQVRDYVHTADVIAAVRLALGSEDWKGPVVIGAGRSLSVLQVLDAVRQATGAELQVRHGPARPGEMPAVIVDPSHARRLGWAPRYSFEEGLAGVWEEWSALDRDAVQSGAGALGMAVAGGAAVKQSTVGSPHSAPTADVAELAPEERAAAAAFLAANPPGLGAPLAVVIPAYNEEPAISEVIAEIPGEAAGLQSEVIVVVDGYSDRTAARALEAGALVCDVSVNRGQGAALKLGYWLARARGAQVIATIDADGQYEPEELGRVVQPILEGRADFVSGSRRLGAELTTDRVRHLGVLLFGAAFSLMVGHRITDPACGLRAMRAEVTSAVTLEQPQYQASELMISAALNGFRLAEVPTTMRDRASYAGHTKKDGNLRYGVRFARAAFHTWRRDRKAARTRLRPEKIQCS